MLRQRFEPAEIRRLQAMAAESGIDLALFPFWTPRIDQPDRGDEQTAFVESKHPGITYLLGGNGAGTTTTALFKAAKFMLEDQIAPRRDTPFWIIAETYEQVMEACWKEKLYGIGLIPECEIDWDRIQWYRPNDNWPFRVPLKPHPKHPQSNWVIEFKSYKQGRSKMQARSIGGFLFVEQFPWGILEEVVRGCREYAFLGNKLAEFTPVDPSKTVELQEMIERNTLPASDHVYYANTECAVEAGHVTQQWFDQFFGMVPPGMRECRMRGKFGAFEGAIYPMFDPKVHEVTDDDIAAMWGDAFGNDVFYRRTIDWGAGPSNAFVNLWYYMRPIRDKDDPAKIVDYQYYVFDEYYSTNQLYTTPNHLVEVIDRSKAWGWVPDSMWYGATYADPSSPERIRTASKLSEYVSKDRPDIKGISITPANNSVMEGIEHVQYLMLPSASLGGQCRLYINRDRCPHLCSELKRYRWATASETGPDAPKQPFKKDDHAPDALRYGVFTEASRSLSGSTIKRVAKQHSERASMRFKNSGRQQIEGVRA